MRKLAIQRGSNALQASLKKLLRLIPMLVLICTSGQVTVLAQNPPELSARALDQTMSVGPVEPLAKLVSEAEQSNPRIITALRAWQAAEQVPSQVSTLPDPQIVVQQFAVGSPIPFAGFSNSDFAYIGFGISQDFPYPGKLRLRGEIAHSDASTLRDQMGSVQREVVEKLKADYFQLAYFQKTFLILERDQKLLEQVEKIAEARYRTGQGNQQDVLKAQLEETKILREIVHHHEQMGQREAEIKELLNRPADSPDITPADVTETALPYTADELLDRVRADNPDVTEGQDAVRSRSLALEAARKDSYPDFNIGYMWQHTAAQFRDYYMLTFGVRVPLWRTRKQQPEVVEAAASLDSSRHEYEAKVQQAYFQVRDQYLAADADSRLLKIYREGLMPQATAAFQAGMAAYQSGTEDFETLLSSFLDVLNLEMEYWQTLANHEVALAEIERVTGVSLP